MENTSGFHSQTPVEDPQIHRASMGRCTRKLIWMLEWIVLYIGLSASQTGKKKYIFYEYYMLSEVNESTYSLM